MDTTTALLLGLGAGAVLGALLGWLLARSRSAAIAARLAITDEALNAERERLGTLRHQADELRAALDRASNDIARLEERSGRVPALEGRLVELNNTLEARAAELRALASANSQNTEKATQAQQQLAESQRLLVELQQKLDANQRELQRATEARASFEQQAQRLPALDQERDALRAQLTQTTGELTELRTRADAERRAAQEKLELLEQARIALSDQFKSLAGEILEEKSKRFAEQNQTSLNQLLEPLKTQLTEFKGKVEEVYVQEGKDRSALSEQVKQLVGLNQTLSQDAKNLTQALKGQAKTQGTWGELVLERVLEASGLRKGIEYQVQDSQTREDGSRAQPDVVINLPDERKLVIDAKVSLLAYERCVSADNDEARAIALRQHLDSVRAHIKGLSDKRYEALYGVQSLDFVLAFIPVEPAFMLAVTHDDTLFMDAWQRNVLLVSPSTLLFVVRTVAHLWRQEAQTRNAQDIAKRGAELYDKLCGFVADLEDIGDRLNQAQKAYIGARSKLSQGRGNVIRQAEILRELGIKPTKALPTKLVQAAGDDSTQIGIGLEPQNPS